MRSEKEKKRGGASRLKGRYRARGLYVSAKLKTEEREVMNDRPGKSQRLSRMKVGAYEQGDPKKK